MEDENWSLFLDTVEEVSFDGLIVKRTYAEQACKMAILENLQALEECKSLNEVYQLISVLKLKYN